MRRRRPAVLYSGTDYVQAQRERRLMAKPQARLDPGGGGRSCLAGWLGGLDPIPDFNREPHCPRVMRRRVHGVRSVAAVDLARVGYDRGPDVTGQSASENQVRTGLPAGGNRIRTTGPSRGASLSPRHERGGMPVGHLGMMASLSIRRKAGCIAEGRMR